MALAGCAQEVHDAAWDDLVTARQQDAIDRGWVPEWLPEDATDLVERNHPESGEVVVRATLPSDEWLDACTPTDQPPARPDLSPDWWQPGPDGVPHTCDDDWSALREADLLWIWTLGDTVILEDDPDEDES
ncbi:hypothetical protein [Salsipaludibacter albus]|uniref:hypothetical protein n=1 Tax=Salsipaludibacter albus TaxID=2849650 RepID=UPI001EE47946|nr:hypothetical protein [Salsipaludibacter albus]MBY5162302.1 hypothetical protein [Salsipaludibacter albus]